jgi:hypothetical protein
MTYSQIESAWKPLSPFISVPHTEEEYKRLVTHHLTSLMELVGTLIENYESENINELA